MPLSGWKDGKHRDMSQPAVRTLVRTNISVTGTQTQTFDLTLPTFLVVRDFFGRLTTAITSGTLTVTFKDSATAVTTALTFNSQKNADQDYTTSMASAYKYDSGAVLRVTLASAAVVGGNGFEFGYYS